MTASDDSAAWSPNVVALGGASRYAIEQVLRAVPPRSSRCYVIAYTGPDDVLATARLATTMPVLVADSGTTLQADRVFVVPRGREATIARGRFEVTDADPDSASIDRLFRSIGDELGSGATCVVLSGAGNDGALGIKRVKESDGFVIAQAPADAEDPQMPLSAIETGVVDLILAASEIGARLGSIVAVENESIDDEHRRRDAAADTLRDILTLVRIRTGHDFAQYKRPTLYRRVARRMQVCECVSLPEYHRFLRDHPGELSHLLRDFLISVTNFFRDPEAFDALARLIIPKLFAGKSSGDQVRLWVAGCATGEEAYSIGMLLLEHAGRLSNPPGVQVFATDIDEDALAAARAGRYSGAMTVDVSPERLARFFQHEGNQYRVTKELREIVLFSPHNLLRDPPFSRLDLISCRNVLIYLNREAQDRVLAMFHFGLRPDGYLFLGSSESAEAAALQFGTVEAKARLFSRRMGPVDLAVPAMLASARWQTRAPTTPPPTERPSTSFGDLHHRIVEHYAPPSVLVNDDFDILHMSEHAGRYLQFAGGEPTRQLLRLVHPALRVELRSAIYVARQNSAATERGPVRYELAEGETRAVNLRVQPVSMPDLGGGLMLVLFDEIDVAAAAEVTAAAPPTVEPVVRELEEDLQHTREQLRTSVEQYETSLEELKASNEELQAINEELRSATEELETSKEELQSVNEELTTLNHELKSKIDEVSRANSDLQNLMASTDIAVLFLDRSMNIKRFTRRAVDLFNVIASDVGRPLAHITHRLAIDDVGETARDVLQHLRVIEREISTQSGDRYLLRVLPYRSLEDRIDGVVLTFIDIGELRRTEAALRGSEARFRLALGAAPAIATTRDARGTCTWAYALGSELPTMSNLAPFLVGDEGRKLAELETAALRDRAGQRLELGILVEGEQRIFDTRIEPILDDGEITGLITVGFDITSGKRAEDSLREVDRKKDEFIATLSHELRNPLTPLRVALDVQKLSPDDPDSSARSRAIMDRQVDHLITLVDDLLDLSRITQGKLDLALAAIDIREILAAAVEDTRSMAEDSHHRIRVSLSEERLIVKGDRARLSQVFVNLVVNACKYTPDGGDIAIEAVRDGGRALVIVRDDGVGLLPEQLDEIFELFAQSRDARGRSRGGLGIGLNLVRNLVAMHGGEVSAASDGPGHGSTFTVSLPIA